MVATVVLAVGAFIGSKRTISAPAMTGGFAIAAVVLVSGGAVAGLNGEREIKEHCSGIDDGQTKPIVMPSRVEELSVHTVAPLSAHRGNVRWRFAIGPIEWGLCYVHPVRYIR